MARPGASLVVDIGNSRIKWGKIGVAGKLTQSEALPIDRPDLWSRLWEIWFPTDVPAPVIAISSVNPRVAAQVQTFLEDQQDGKSSLIRLWYRSAADVPISHRLKNPETAGADRALAVAAALESLPDGRPGLIVSCGTAITIERITRERIWQGGAIAPGLGLSARILNQHTAQLPLVNVGGLTPAWGNSTRPAIEAGVFWTVVGGIRELLSRQTLDLSGDPWLVWTGGDAEILASVIIGNRANIAPDLVLQGLIRVSSLDQSERGL